MYNKNIILEPILRFTQNEGLPRIAPADKNLTRSFFIISVLSKTIFHKFDISTSKIVPVSIFSGFKNIIIYHGRYFIPFSMHTL